MVKSKPIDFKKIKKKVGKAKKAPRNITRTDFKAARIHMPNQHAIASKNGATTRRNMNLTDIIGHIKHHNAHMRASAFTQMRELFADSDGLLQMHVGHVVEATSLTVLDAASQVRKEYRTFLRWLLSEVTVDLQPFYPFLHLQIKASLTHVDPNVRKDGLLVLELFLAHPDGPRILRGCSRVIVKLLVQIGVGMSPVSASLLCILRQVLSFEKTLECGADNQGLSIQDMLASGKKTNTVTHTGLANLALRAYMEAGEGVEGLQLKMNACALLEKVENPPWDDMAHRLFVDFPISAHCPPKTNRGVYTALVSSVNLLLASLMASSPQHPSASSSTLAYLETVTKQLKASDSVSIDDDDDIAVQSVSAKVARIVKILRAARGNAEIARIITQICLPKNDSAAELKSSRVRLMIPFVADMCSSFDPDIVIPWLQVWPKVLWSSTIRSELLSRILTLAQSSPMLFGQMQRFLLPFYIGFGPVPGPLLQCSASDQAMAISILFYLQGNWNRLTPKIAPLLKSTLDDRAKELLFDILLVKDTETPIKLRLLLSMILHDESWRKAASFTIGIKNYWTTIACPLAQRARAIDGSSNWLRYLIACARPSEQVLTELLTCIALCPVESISAFVEALYQSTYSVSEVYEVSCKQCVLTNSPRMLEALILDKKHHHISTDGWGGVFATTFFSEHLDQLATRAAKATISELRGQLASWDFPLLPML